MHLFYGRDLLSVLQCGSEGISFFRGGKILLAQKLCDETTLFCTDYQNSTVRLLSREVHENTIFDPFGGGAVRSGVGFKGEYMDVSIHAYWLGQGHRAYSPKVARFLRPDSLSPFDIGGINCYAFALNDPVNGSDPTGQYAQFAMQALARVKSIARALLKIVLKPLTKEAYSGRVLMGGDDFTVFSKDGYSRGTSTLYIDAHGGPGYLYKGTTAMPAAKVVQKMKAKGIAVKERKIHVLACNSAVKNADTGRSFIEDMSNLTRGAVSGYEDYVYTYSFAERYSGMHDLAKLYVPYPFKGVSNETVMQGIRMS